MKEKWIESRHYGDGRAEAKLHKKLPQPESRYTYGVYFDSIGKGKDYETVEVWTETLENRENFSNTMLDNLKAGKWIDITDYC